MIDEKKFYVVATPIGNLGDVTYRAVEILKLADFVLCEDTRYTKILLDKYEVHTPTMSYHTHSKFSKIEKIIAFVEGGKTLALVSDAGTPAISDPGSILVARLKDYFKDKLKIIPIPGANAAIALLSAAGISVSDFLFLGFLPHKKGRQTLFAEITESKRTVVFYESPHRIMKTLNILTMVGEKKTLVIGRELTKIHEEIISGAPLVVYQYFLAHKEKIRGEFTVAISGK